MTWNKNHFSSFLKGFQLQKIICIFIIFEGFSGAKYCLKPETAPLNILTLFLIQGWMAYSSNIIRSLFYLLKQILNFSHLFLFSWYLLLWHSLCIWGFYCEVFFLIFYLLLAISFYFLDFSDTLVFDILFHSLHIHYIYIIYIQLYPRIFLISCFLISNIWCWILNIFFFFILFYVFFC